MKKMIASLLTVATVASMASVTALADSTEYVGAATFNSKSGNTYSASEKLLADNEVNPDTKIYINLNAVSFDTVAGADVAASLIDEDLFKIKTDKGDDDSKMIKKISVTEKDINGDSTREVVVKIELNDDMSDDEFKINPSVTFTAKEDIDLNDDDTADINDGDKLTVNLGNVYVSNTELAGDKDWKAGVGGYVAKPVKNDDNEITWEDENETLACLTFEADDDAGKYYPKLSTKWNDADYAENFADTDAFIRSFVGNPTIDSTSRPVLEMYNPFVEDEEATVAVEDIVIYELVDGALVDVTDKFTADENEDGDSVFTIKTRNLGTYIFSNGEAVAPAEEEAPVEEDVEAPADKVNPGTGRF